MQSFKQQFSQLTDKLLKRSQSASPMEISQSDDEAMVQIMQQRLQATSNCIDVGCHSGGFLTEILQLAPQGQHYAFEPIPSLADLLKTQFPQVNVQAAALSDTNGETTFHHVVSNPGYSGLRERRYDRPNEQIELIPVTTLRLDDFLPADYHLDLIKIDVEGAEWQVFQGAVETLKRNRPIVLFEHGQGGSDRYGTTPEMIHNFLVGECGLTIATLHDPHPLTAAELRQVYDSGTAWNFVAYP
ncbi:MAG: FkbM family methyltransferase [Synechococcales bacterium]|nr:FkbM family methyltransferase [Synechococcales bacterium]